MASTRPKQMNRNRHYQYSLNNFKHRRQIQKTAKPRISHQSSSNTPPRAKLGANHRSTTQPTGTLTPICPPLTTSTQAPARRTRIQHMFQAHTQSTLIGRIVHTPFLNTSPAAHSLYVKWITFATKPTHEMSFFAPPDDPGRISRRRLAMNRLAPCPTCH